MAPKKSVSVQIHGSEYKHFQAWFITEKEMLTCQILPADLESRATVRRNCSALLNSMQMLLSFQLMIWPKFFYYLWDLSHHEEFEKCTCNQYVDK